jgi:hypothetical protein
MKYKLSIIVPLSIAIVVLAAAAIFQSQRHSRITANDIAAADCSPSLKSCGPGCIPQDAVCCDPASGNSYCLAPNTLCKTNPEYGTKSGESRFLCSEDGGEFSHDCPAGQTSCGMFCVVAGGKCCFGGICHDDKVNSNTPAGAVVYDGIYTGKFNYEYQDWDQLNGRAVSDWVPSSFELTMTLKTVRKSNNPPYVFLDASNVVSSDPGFGTGSGVDVTAYFDGQESVSLPADPSKQDALDSSLILTFPNRAMIEVREGTGFGGKSTMIVSPDGKTLSSDPSFVTACTGEPCYAWVASAPAGTLLKTAPATDSKKGFWVRHYKFESWTLKKTSS